MIADQEQITVVYLTLSTSYTSSVSLLKIIGCKRDWETMKYVLKLGPDQERQVLNNYLINSGCIANHCHPNDFIAWVVTNHDLCSWSDCSNNCSMPPLLFVMLMGPEYLKKNLYKTEFPNIAVIITSTLWFSAEFCDQGSLHCLPLEYYLLRIFWNKCFWILMILKSDLF